MNSVRSTDTRNNGYDSSKWGLKKWPLKLSIRQKLIYMAVAVGFVAVLISGTVITAYQYVNYKSQMLENITAQAQMIGIASQPALAFDDVEDASTILGSLQGVPSVVYASLLKADGELFVEYIKSGVSVSPEPPPVGNESAFGNRWLLVAQDIYLGDTELIGRVFIQSSNAELDRLLLRSVIAIVLAIVAALLISYVLASRLQALISAPIIELTRTAVQVTQNQDYSVRAEVASDDELGVLSDSFNIMMENISQRDQSLVEYRENLEELVQERTQELEHAHAELISKERLATLGQLTATVAHEIRNPLGTIRTSVFAMNEAVEKRQFDRISRITALAEKSVQRCDHIITELLDYSRKRKLILQRENVDDWLNGFLDVQEIPEEIQCLRDLNTSLILEFDREHLRRAVANVVTNGVQALQEKDDKDKVLTVRTTVNDGHLEIIVTDNGLGISEAELAKIFEPLYSTKSFGVGLGLPVVQGIMFDHNGGVTISSRENESTSVMLWFPTNLGSKD